MWSKRQYNEFITIKYKQRQLCTVNQVQAQTLERSARDPTGRISRVFEYLI